MGIGFQGDDAAADSVGTGALEDGAVTTAKLATGAVTTDRIADGAVTSVKLASGIVGSSQIANDAVGSQHIATNAVGADELADNAVDTNAIANNAVTSGKIATNAVGSSHIADGSVTSDEIATNAVGSDELANNAVDTAAIADGAVTAAKLAAGAVETAATADGSITQAKLATAQAFTASGSIVSTGGRIVTFTGSSGQTLTLPAAAVGLEFEIVNIDSADSVTLARAGSDTIAGGTSVTIPAGGRYVVECTSSGSWLIRTTTIPLVSTLPATPFDGMEVRYQNAGMLTDGVVWTFRYNASESGSYKWEFVSGPPWQAEVDTGETTNNNTFTNLTTSGPAVTNPLAGDYYVEHGCVITAGAANTGLQSFAVGGTAAVDADAVSHYGAVTEGASVQRRRRKNAIAASSSIAAKYRASGGTGHTWGNRFLSILPIRVG